MKFNTLLIVIVISIINNAYCSSMKIVKNINSNGRFTLDTNRRIFLKDGQPFRYISGSMHYFRIPHQYWRDRLRKLRSMGANAIETYVEWSLHEPEPGQFMFEDDSDVIRFIKIAQEEDLLVILRPGPYICAERNFGGLPYWLLRLNPKMKLRTSSRDYMYWVNKWLTRLLTMIKPLLYSNGGPIILVQIENEYGSYKACDPVYTSQLVNIFDSILGQNSVLYFTTDGCDERMLKCGNVNGAISTVDFGPSPNMTVCFDRQRDQDVFAPLVNSEFYTGWLDHWSEKHQETDSKNVAWALDQLITVNQANVNLYMFHGGTSFGFTSGANYDFANELYQPQPTSYDYDAPLDESGDLTTKYYDLKRVIDTHFAPILSDNLSYSSLTTKSPKLSIDKINISRISYPIFYLVNVFGMKPIQSVNTLTFEEMYQPNGFMIYAHNVTIEINQQVSVIEITGLNDRAIIYVNGTKVAILSRMVKKTSANIVVNKFDLIHILVEDQGRINYGEKLLENKGITGQVKLNGIELLNWVQTNVPLHKSEFIDELLMSQRLYFDSITNLAIDMSMPLFYRADFVLNENAKDTFVLLNGFTKGLVWINGFNLGRYWPVVGPQVTLYLPGVKLFDPPKVNKILIFELEQSPCANYENCYISFVDKPYLNATPALDPTFDSIPLIRTNNLY